MRRAWYGIALSGAIYQIDFDLMTISRTARYYPGTSIAQVYADDEREAILRFRRDLGYRIAPGVDPDKIIPLHGSQYGPYF